MNDTPSIPACLTRDNLTSPYFPNLSFAGLLAIATLCGAFLLTSFNRLNHTDLWCHLNFGRWIAEHRALPAVDPIAAEPSALPVLHSAWLSQVAGYELQSRFGNEGLALAHAMLVMLSAGVLMLAVHRRGAPAVWAWSAGAAMFLLSLPIVGTIRPQLFGQLGATLFLLACSQMPKSRWPLVWLPLVALLWANLHGTIAMGLAMLGIYAVGITWIGWFEAAGELQKLIRDPRLHVVWGAVVLALAAACINPHGPWLLASILYFPENSTLASISEWRALTPNSLTGVLMIASVGLTALLVKFSPKKWEVYEIGLLVIFGLATLPAIRMLAWWAIVWPWACIPHAAAAWRKYQSAKTGQPIEGDDEPTAMRTVIAMGLVFATLLIAPPTFSLIAGNGRGEAAISVTGTPIYVADEVLRRDLEGNIASPMDWSDFLLWKTSGRLRPLVHSHVHLASPQIWKDYETIFRGDEQWLALLRTHQMQYVAVPKNGYPKLYEAVLRDDRTGQGGVRIVYQDQRCLLAEVLPPAPPKPAVEQSS